MADISLQFKAQAASAALGAVTGERPVIAYQNDYARLYWDTAQVAKLQGKVDKRLTKGVTMALAPATPPKSGDIVVDWGPVVNPVLAKRALPALVGVSVAVLALGFLIGRLSKKRR
jgi:hypothetical protein